ncbi:serine/threonine-protein kinase, partial [Roseisolibacter sp. H3M3-2]|uniref:serine/threonine-protein kinase n=1 Tax=Roseisolibacter sp. H3M3-2 TaxID=3031323 RepID=UPI0023D9F2E6
AGGAPDFLGGAAAAYAAPLLDGAARDDAADGMTDALRDALAARDLVVERELARGGMAVVYLARDVRHDRRVAIKVLPRDSLDAGRVERFLAEIRVTAGLSHPHVLPLHASGEGDGRPYYVTPFVAGESLRQRLARDGALPAAEAARLLRDVASALDHAHRRGVVHRDVKPENVLLTEDGHAVVADFGIARAVRAASPRRTLPGVAFGTPAYLAPEQARGDPAADHRADLYALGVVAYEALAGEHPFGARPPEEMVAAHLGETPPPLAGRRPELPRALTALVTRLLDKDPARRPPDAAAVVRALEGRDAPDGRRRP